MRGGCAVAAVAHLPPGDDRGWLLVVLTCEWDGCCRARHAHSRVMRILAMNDDVMSSVRPHACCVLIG